MTKTVTMIDPPSGWRYGFPKPLTLRYPDQSHTEWLVEQGYPQREIDACGKHFFCRYWEEETRECTCHPDDNPPVPCQKQYALSECRRKANES